MNPMNKKTRQRQFVVCVRNDGYEASLERNKLYQLVPDAAMEQRHVLRVIDESGEDYLYPEAFFMPIEVPKAVEKALTLAS